MPEIYPEKGRPHTLTFTRDEPAKIKCRDCRFISDPYFVRSREYSSVRCTLGLWDKAGVEQWYSYGESQLNRGPVRRLGEKCIKGEAKRCAVCKQPADGLVNGECARCRTRGKFTGEVELEDRGQDFTRWKIEDGVVVASEPFQDWVWKGTLVHNAVIAPGDILLISPPNSTARVTLNYPVTKVKQTAVNKEKALLVTCSLHSP